MIIGVIVCTVPVDVSHPIYLRPDRGPCAGPAVLDRGPWTRAMHYALFVLYRLHLLPAVHVRDVQLGGL